MANYDWSFLLNEPEHERKATEFVQYIESLNLEAYISDYLTCITVVESPLEELHSPDLTPPLEKLQTEIIADNARLDVESASQTSVIFRIPLGSLYDTPLEIIDKLSRLRWPSEDINKALDRHAQRASYLTKSKLQEIHNQILETFHGNSFQNKLTELNGTMQITEEYTHDTLIQIKFTFKDSE